MLPLKFLYDNRQLATCISELWDRDPEKREWFEHFRISSNAIYPMAVFRENDGPSVRAMLRFAPSSEKGMKRLIAELDLMTYLHSKDYTVASHIPSKTGDIAHEIETPWGVYVANVFEGLPGVTVEEVALDIAMAHRLGVLLGKFHRLSTNYKQAHAHKLDLPHRAIEGVPFLSVFDYCDSFIENPRNLIGLPEDFFAIAAKVKAHMHMLKARTSHERWGLIHYDFELDNLLYCRERDILSVVDFDDAMYAWYDMDLVRLLDNIDENLSETRESSDIEALQNAVLEGYETLWPSATDGISDAQLYRDFMDLNWIYRVQISLQEVNENLEPEWMHNLRQRLTNRSKVRLDQLIGRYVNL